VTDRTGHMGNAVPLSGEVRMPWKECSVVDERLWPASLVNRIVLPHEDADILNPAVNYTRFEAIFLAGLRKGGMPEE
jgi:hypothetical protein